MFNGRLITYEEYLNSLTDFKEIPETIEQEDSVFCYVNWRNKKLH